MKEIYKFKIKISQIDNFENYFPKLKDYIGWVEVSVEPAVKALFCAAFDVKDKKELQDKVLEILNFYKDAPLLKSYSNKEDELFDKFNICFLSN